MSEHPYDVSTYWHDRAKAAEAEVRDLRAKVAAVEARISASDLIVRMRELTYFGESQIAGQVVSRMMRERASVGRTEPEGGARRASSP